MNWDSMHELQAPGLYPAVPLSVTAAIVVFLLVLLRRWGLLTMPS